MAIKVNRQQLERCQQRLEGKGALLHSMRTAPNSKLAFL